MLFAVPNRFKYRQNACFRDIVFTIVTEVIRVVSNSVRLHALFSKLSLQFQNIISNSVSMNNLTVNVFKIIRWGWFTSTYQWIIRWLFFVKYKPRLWCYVIFILRCNQWVSFWHQSMFMVVCFWCGRKLEWLEETHLSNLVTISLGDVKYQPQIAAVIGHIVMPVGQPVEAVDL